jgi:hypothetical protein
MITTNTRKRERVFSQRAASKRKQKPNCMGVPLALFVFV